MPLTMSSTTTTTSMSSTTEMNVLHHHHHMHDDEPLAIDIPAQFICPISLTLMTDPVTLPSGHTFDRRSIEKWIHDGHTTCPFTRQTIGAYEDLVPNHILRRIIHSWCQRNNLSNYGFDVAGAITPPPEPTEIPLLLDSMDGHGAVDPADALAKLCHLCSSRPRYRRQLIDAGALAKLGRLLSKSNLSTATGSEREIPKLALKLAEVVTEGMEDVQGTEEFVRLVAGMAAGACREYVEWGDPEGKVVARVCVGVLSRVKMTEGMRRVVGGTKGFMESVVRVIGGSGGWWTKAGMSLLVELCKRPTSNDNENNAVLAVEAGAVECIVEHLRRRRRKMMAAAATCSSPPQSNHLSRGTLRLASHLARSTAWLTKLRKWFSHAHVHHHHAPPPPPSIPPLQPASSTPHKLLPLPSTTIHIVSFYHRKSALRVLEVLSHSAEARASIAPHIGLIVDHMCGSSHTSTFLATNILWLLLQAYPFSSALKQQAIQHGALIKAIAIMQCASAPAIRCAAMRVATCLLELTPPVSQTVILSSDQFVLK